MAGLLASCSGSKQPWHGTDITGVMPDLQLSMTRAGDGKAVTGQDFRGRIAILYFGYTYCPDICPLTLTNVAAALKKLGDKADDVRVLFVTVDPNRDTLDVLRQYADAFAPQMVGLRGTPDQIASLTKRYRAAYSVNPHDKNGEYVVTHSPAVYVFDRDGKARVLYTSLASSNANVDGMAKDLERLIGNEGAGGGLFSWL